MRYLLLSVVGGVHVAVIGGVLLMQGCGTTRGPVALPSAPPMPPALAEEDMPPVASGVETYKPVTVEEAVAAATPALRPSAPSPVPSAPVDSSRTYVVGRGDSLSVIARRHGVSTAEIMILNNISNPNRIRMGQSLKLPAGATLKAPEAPKAVTPKPAAAAATTTKAAAGAGSYVVKAGDSLSVVAHRNGTTVKALQELNDLKSDKIVVGQKLVIPSASSKPAVGTTSAPKPAVDRPPVAAAASLPALVPELPSAALAPEPVMPTTRNSYTAKVGDDILTVASEHNVSISDLRRVNNLTSDTLIPGQTLVIPAGE
jgi:peptidoglycan endopeptidase LytF